MSYLHEGSYKKTILSLYQVGVPSEHLQNEDEEHLKCHNIGTKRNLNGRIRVIFMQDSGLPAYNHNYFEARMSAVFKEKGQNIMWN